MTSARLIGPETGFKKRFTVEIDLSDLGDSSFKLLFKDLEKIPWDFCGDLIKIIKKE